MTTAQGRDQLDAYCADVAATGHRALI